MHVGEDSDLNELRSAVGGAVWERFKQEHAVLGFKDLYELSALCKADTSFGALPPKFQEIMTNLGFVGAHASGQD